MKSYKQIRLTKVAPSADEAVVDCLQVVDVPERPSPGDDELLLRVRLSAIHPCDLLCCAGLVARSRTVSAAENNKFLPGIEAAASIEQVGKDLRDEFVEGSLVAVKAWSPWGYWQEADGVWSEYVVVKKEKVIAVPEGVNEVTAAMFISVSVTAYVMLIEELQLQEGDWLIQAAAGSALGRWIIAFANAMGINVINLVRREEQVAELKNECGADHVLWCPADGSRTEELVNAIKELTQGKNVRGGLDPVADGVVASIMLRTMSRYGKLLKFGTLADSPMTLSRPALLQMSQEGLLIKGFSVQNWWIPDTPDAEKRGIFNRLWKIIKENKELSFKISSLYPFDRVDEAIKASLAQKSAKVFLTPRPEDRERYLPFIEENQTA